MIILSFQIIIQNIFNFSYLFQLGPIALIFQINGLSPNTVTATKFVNYNGTTYPNIYQHFDFMRPLQTTDQNGYISDDLLGNIHLASGSENIEDKNFIDYITMFNQDSQSNTKYFTGLITKDSLSKDNLRPYVSHGDVDILDYMPYDYIIANFNKQEQKNLQLVNFTFPDQSGNIINQIEKSNLGNVINLDSLNLLAQNYSNNDIKFSDIVLNTINRFDQLSTDYNNNPYFLIIQSSVPSDAIKENDTVKLISELTEIDKIIQKIDVQQKKILLLSTAEVGGFNIPDNYSNVNSLGLQQPQDSDWDNDVQNYMNNIKQIIQHIKYAIPSNRTSMEQVVLCADNLNLGQLKSVNNVTQVNKLIKSLISNKEYDNKYNIALNDRWWYSYKPEENNSQVATIIIVVVVIVIALVIVGFVIYQIIKSKRAKKEASQESLIYV